MSFILDGLGSNQIITDGLGTTPQGGQPQVIYANAQSVQRRQYSVVDSRIPNPYKPGFGFFKPSRKPVTAVAMSYAGAQSSTVKTRIYLNTVAQTVSRAQGSTVRCKLVMNTAVLTAQREQATECTKNILRLVATATSPNKQKSALLGKLFVTGDILGKSGKQGSVSDGRLQFFGQSGHVQQVPQVTGGVVAAYINVTGTSAQPRAMSGSVAVTEGFSDDELAMFMTALQEAA